MICLVKETDWKVELQEKINKHGLQLAWIWQKKKQPQKGEAHYFDWKKQGCSKDISE